MNESSDSPLEPSPAGTAIESTTTETPDTLGIGLVTIADDRSLESDAAGKAIVSAFTEAGHEVVMREHVGREHDTVQSIVSRMIDRGDVDVVVTAGATSIEPDDITIEAVQPLIEKSLTTFSELFTHLSYEAHGSRVVGARTISGVTEGTLIFVLPGNADAAELAATEILVPESPNLVELARDGDDSEDTEKAAAASDDSTAAIESDEAAKPNGGEDV
ncbi:molybdopterin adenylyltransferase [Natrialba magadii ATCC 43099]|uniref:Molybdenum cofactor synthesis protein n=1 Tax=Natrialba magadii (strain ATCC 43099 / DSM 3394 / CCM 3739 / CIP 104546 / IAM 13178 / JCM 8861 / NBRC 102185 / NCIMB 2190 / MS3) TaxID=547559 RepID=D3SZL7_NATMM|nr:molybdopterin-binding protein [Natrialba magadii]ADD06277.1 molybdopterin adenylyltransferase [Natrialba magadii ATCC 43099]ELY31287.1 molybdenum cofactor synthesis protein [Natrialba magadii ATCC 43099]